MDNDNNTKRTTPGAAMTTAKPSPTVALQRIRTRLEKLELEHLRRVICEQAERIEELQAQLTTAREDADYAWQCADRWQEQHMTTLQEAMEMGAKVGLTRYGEIVLLTTEGAEQTTTAQDEAAEA